MKKNVFIIGSKGIPAKYGGFETFVDELVTRSTDSNINYFVSCRKDLSDNKSNTYDYHGATCFNISVSKIGGATAILYDIKSFEWVLKYAKENNIENPIIYVLACRIGPFIGGLKKKLKRLNGELLVNPDGHEWKREKWSYPVKKYWKISEGLMVKHADLLVCDSKSIEKYIQHDYKKYQPKTTYISYGSDITKSILEKDDEKVSDWYKKHGASENDYYLIVGRFVPENNYETMIKEFMKSKTAKDLVIITNVEKNDFYKKLLNETKFDTDKRIKFVGTVYDKQLLKYIRENAYGYLHGHEVGGTNPSLLEALGSTKLNLLLNVGFNKEVGIDSSIYWDKSKGSLANLIDKADKMSIDKINGYDDASTKRIDDYFSWNKIVKQYTNLFEEY